MKFPDITKRPWRNISMMIIGVCNILNGVILIVSLGFCYVDFATSYALWRTRKIWGVK